ncbi:hypothetical protein NYO67_2139 [Aspergillus flavus]|nr:hypothetical protein NYO67_2139 [Aspergillus flavus]
MREDHDLVYLFYTATASHPLLGSLERGTGFFGGNRRDKLPEEQFSRRALDAFFQCAATLFYVTTPENTEKLLQRVYHSDHASIPDICELSALASIGSHYKKDLIPDEAKAAYLYLASTGLQETIGADHIQGMRIFICLSMSCIMDKSSSARLLIMPGLDFARAKMETDLRKVTSNQSDEDEYRRTLQTLLFLEGWLSYSLGYQSCLKQSEIDLVQYTIPLDTTSINSVGLRTRLIQSQMTKLALLASQIQAKITSLRDGSWSKADEISADLDKWYYSLPPDLQLATLTKQEEAVTSQQRHGIYLMHMLHVDMRLQLFCRLIKGFATHREVQDLSSLETFYHKIPRQNLDDHKDFSIQLARIAALLYEEEAILARCCRSVFDAGVVLLLGVCLYYLDGRETNAVADMLRNLDLCLTVLEFCSRDDIAAMRLKNMLDPLVREFRRTRQASRVQQGQGHSMGVEYLLNDRPPEKPDLVRLTHRLLNFMTPTRDVWV